MKFIHLQCQIPTKLPSQDFTCKVFYIHLSFFLIFFSDVNIAIRKIANMLKPDKEIIQDGDHMIIKTLSTFKNYIMDFDIGKEFEEDLTGVDDRKCMVRTERLLSL